LHDLEDIKKFTRHYLQGNEYRKISGYGYRYSTIYSVCDTAYHYKELVGRIVPYVVTFRTRIDIVYIAFLAWMNNIKRIMSFSLVAGMFFIAALATSSLGTTRTAFAQNTSTAMNQTAAQMNQTAAQNMSNQTAAQMNQTASQMNQTAAQSANKTSTNQTSSNNPKLTTSDVQDIRKSLEEIRKDIADGKATEALKAINDMDNKLLVSMSSNPPPMLEKSTGNDDSNKNN
jgi:ABC-type multidrug transport system fused ATPase/permease subunit